MSELALSLQDIQFGYGRVKVLDDLSLDVPQQSITALLGPNGSGKTTILNLLLGILRPWSGSVRVLGDPIEGMDRRQLSRRLGLVPQQEQAPFALSVTEWVVLGRAPYLHLLQQPTAEDRRAARKSLLEVGLEGLANRLVPDLSGGEQQLASVARALTQQPAILLMDEPTSHLDLRNRRRVLDVMLKQSEGGRTVLMTTHDPNAAAAVASHVVLLKQGRITAQGPPGEVITEQRLSEVYDVQVRVETVRGQSVVLA